MFPDRDPHGAPSRIPPPRPLGSGPGPRQPVAPLLLSLVGAALTAFVAVALLMRFAGSRIAVGGASSGFGPRAAVVTKEVAARDAGAPASGPSADAAAPAVPIVALRRPRSVLFLTIDTLRHDLGFAGYPRPITPNLDALAARSAVFERAYSLASYTPKSMGPMMIGRYGTETVRNSEHYTTFFPPNTFLAERAHDAGLRTFGGVCHRYFLWKKGFQDGFDIYDTSAAPPDPRDEDPRLTSEKLSDAAIALLKRPENHGRPFFAWFHYIDPHTPYVPHPEAPRFDTMPPAGTPSARSAYDAEVWYTDAQVGRVLDFVRAQPWANDTAIVVTADHGESFGEHGHYRHGRELWEALVRVPLIVHVPDAAPVRVAPKRSHIDLVPTLLDLLGLPADPSLHGASLLPDMAGAPEPPERDVFIDMPKGPYNEARRAVITGPSPGIKLIDFGNKRYEVYDLASDPLEEHPLKRTDERFAIAALAFETRRSELREVAVLP